LGALISHIFNILKKLKEHFGRFEGVPDGHERACHVSDERLGMTGVCGMKKVGHTSFQCLRALVEPERVKAISRTRYSNGGRDEVLRGWGSLIHEQGGQRALFSVGS
jgi:hypothetical protein